MKARSIVLTVLLLTGIAVVPHSVGAAVPNPAVTNPPSPGIHGHPLWDSWFELSGFGYEEAEYFVSGTAKNSAGTAMAPYTTRIIVTRPSTAAKFNGTVLLDWVNVTAQFENAVDSILAQEMLMRKGFAFVHVSAQSAGLCCSPLTPKVWDPVRYAMLSHPGDDYAYDMFSQVAQAVRAPQGVDPMNGLDVQRVIAAGQSQSAGKLYAYVNQAQNPGVVDGFLIHGGGSKSFAHALSVPVLMLLSDWEEAAGTPSSDPNYRLWEVAGSSHSDFWLDYHQEIGQGPRALADAPKQPSSGYTALNETAGNYGEQIHPKELTCIVGGSLFPMRYAASAAIAALDRWIQTGIAPANGPLFAHDSSGQLLRDQYENAVGGIRLPPVEVPVARYVSTLCQLGGVTIPFTEVELNHLYKTHAVYYCAVKEVAEARVTEGYLLAEDAEDLLRRADNAKSRWLDPGTRDC